MIHLTEEEFLLIQNGDVLPNEIQAHFDFCIHCQSEYKLLTEFDSMISTHIKDENSNRIDIRQDVFNRLEIDFNVDNQIDYFSSIAMVLFVISLGITLYLFPISIDYKPLYSWIPFDVINSVFGKYKMVFMGSFAFIALFSIDRIKHNYKYKMNID